MNVCKCSCKCACLLNSVNERDLNLLNGYTDLATLQWAKHLATLQWAKHFAITGLSDVAQDQAQLAQLAQLPVDSRTKTNDEIKEMVRTIGTRRKG